MKSTFANLVSPGTFWIRHNSYQILIGKNFLDLLQLPKDDVVMVLGFFNTSNINVIKDMKLVECYSQKMSRTYTTDLEKFYFNYHKL